MNIAIDISPISTNSDSGHKVRGVGMYIQSLQKSLLSYDPKNHYTFFSKPQNLSQNTDIVHYPYFDPFFFTLPIIRFHKTVVTVHDLTPLVFPQHFPAGFKGNARWFIQKHALKAVNGIITDSECSKNDIIRLIGVPEEKISVVYLAANEKYKKISLSSQQKENLQKKYNLPEKFILYVGDVTWNKNLPRLLDAIIHANVPLVMVGKALTQEPIDKSNPWNADMLFVQNVAIKHNNIIRLGFLPEEELIALYNIATIFIMPSLYEGFGLPIVEAMSCGAPVITSKEGSLPEVAGDSAFYIDAYDSKSMAKGILTVWESKKLQIELSEKGIKQAKKFSWKDTALQTIVAYQKASHS
jgi:glycosyltransferase involved in cell wall biosynthesis